MSKKRTAIFLAAVMLIGVVSVFAPETVTYAGYTDEFLAIVGPMCTNDMKYNKILASFSLAQAIWESGWGRSVLATQANALFGIRAYQGWDGMIFDHNDDKLYDNWKDIYATKGSDYVKSNTLSFWRAYSSWQESVSDHSALFNNMSIYENLRENYDYKSCAKLVVADGYCGEPVYTNCIITLIEQYDLEEYNYDFNGSVPSGSVSISPKTLFMDIGASFTATITNPSELSYTLISGNNAVASVSGTTITAVGEGSAAVTLTADGFSTVCHINVQSGYNAVVADGVYVKCLNRSKDVTIPVEVKTIGTDAFLGTNAEDIVVGNNVVSIQDGAFNGLNDFTLYSYDNSIVKSFASTNQINYINLSTGWVLDPYALIVQNMPVYTIVSVVKNYYSLQGKTVRMRSGDGFELSDTEIVGTGCMLVIDNTTYTVMVRGDTNGDGKHSTADLVIIRSYLCGIDSALPGRAYRRAADFNEDNRITTSDYLLIFRES